MDVADVQALISALATMLVPAPEDQVLLTSFKVGYLARAETNSMDYQVGLLEPHSNQMIQRVTKAQKVFDYFYMEMTQ